MRLFIATPVSIPIYGAIKQDLGRFIEGKWVEGWNLHLTHKFIGEDDPEKYKIKLNVPKEKITVTGVGILGGRILYLKAQSEHISEINSQINEKFGLINEKPFKPHITLCRIKNKSNNLFGEMKKWDKKITEIPFEVFLYSSTLTKKGPVYEKIYKY